MPTALITGAGGQDGRLLARLLLSRGWRVIGLVRDAGGPAEAGCVGEVCDVGDPAALTAALRRAAPDVVHHLAAAHKSSEQAAADPSAEAFAMVAVNFQAAATILAWQARFAPACRVVLVGSSQMYAPPTDVDAVIDEATPMAPRTFYGKTKTWSRELCQYAREKTGVHASFAILFNHESRFRRAGFVTRKIVDAATTGGLPDLRDAYATADWSAAEDIVEALAAMADRGEPGEYVLGSGTKRAIRDWIVAAYSRAGRPIPDIGANDGGGRPALLADSRRAEVALGWRRKISFEDMVARMIVNGGLIPGQRGGVKAGQ
jgi:GDPmannose 4,6-dehydratase